MVMEILLTSALFIFLIIYQLRSISKSIIYTSFVSWMFIDSLLSAVNGHDYNGNLREMNIHILFLYYY